MTWTRSGKPIDFDRIRQTNDVIMTSRHVLTIAEVTLDDFDTYTCQATNQLGSSYGKIYLSGLLSRFLTHFYPIPLVAMELVFFSG